MFGIARNPSQFRNKLIHYTYACSCYSTASIFSLSSSFVLSFTASGSPLRAQFIYRIGKGEKQSGVIDLRLNPELSTDDIFIYQKLIVKDAELLKLEAVAI